MLNAIYTLTSELSILQQELSIAPSDFHTYLNQEKQYLQELKEPLPTVSWKIQYIQALKDLTQYRYKNSLKLFEI